MMMSSFADTYTPKNDDENDEEDEAGDDREYDDPYV